MVVLRQLYTLRCVSAWGDRMWMFSVGLFLAQLSPGSLTWPAAYALVQSLAIVMTAPLLGRWVDQTTPRIKAAERTLVWQNGAVVVCAGVVCVAFSSTWLHQGACVAIIAVGTLASLASVASSLVTKDWIATLACDQQQLARIQSTCRSIDLATNTLAPLVVGQVLYLASAVATGVLIAGWNVVSYGAELWLLRTIYRNNPQLATEKYQHQLQTGQEEEQVGGRSRDRCGRSYLPSRLAELGYGWSVYWSHQVRPAGVVLACLYVTVLGFDGVTTAYAYSQGVSESVLGAVGAAGAVVGLVASAIFPRIVARIAATKTGLLGFGLQLSCLSLCLASVWSPGSPFRSLSPGPPKSSTSITLLLTGITSARCGLWLADLSVNQLLLSVGENVRGSINGVQNSMNMMANTARLVLAMALPEPHSFGWLVCVSYASSCTGALMMTRFWLAKRRSARTGNKPDHTNIDQQADDQDNQDDESNQLKEQQV